jgi:hypothetical protein
MRRAWRPRASSSPPLRVFKPSTCANSRSPVSARRASCGRGSRRNARGRVSALRRIGRLGACYAFSEIRLHLPIGVAEVDANHPARSSLGLRRARSRFSGWAGARCPKTGTTAGCPEASVPRGWPGRASRMGRGAIVARRAKPVADGRSCSACGTVVPPSALGIHGIGSEPGACGAAINSRAARRCVLASLALALVRAVRSSTRRQVPETRGVAGVTLVCLRVRALRQRARRPRARPRPPRR